MHSGHSRRHFVIITSSRYFHLWRYPSYLDTLDFETKGFQGLINTIFYICIHIHVNLNKHCSDKLLIKVHSENEWQLENGLWAAVWYFFSSIWRFYWDIIIFHCKNVFIVHFWTIWANLWSHRNNLVMASENKCKMKNLQRLWISDKYSERSDMKLLIKSGLRLKEVIRKQHRRVYIEYFF